MLEDAGVKTPVPLKFTYPTSETADKGPLPEGDLGQGRLRRHARRPG